MQTQIEPHILATLTGQRANDILRKCVHCGFCTATCPTYQLLGDELDGPRGRIYQVKQILEGGVPDREIMTHFDRCLTCRSCETTCPSGVNYAELMDIGRLYVEQENIRPLAQSLFRRLLGTVLPYPNRNALLFKFVSLIRPLLSHKLQLKAPIIRKLASYKSFSTDNQKNVLLLEGCVQSTLSPNTNNAAQAVLSALGYRVIREPSIACCGAVNHHLSQTAATEQLVENNLKKWSRIHQQSPIHAIVSTASGCGIMLKDYQKLLQAQPEKIEQHASLLEKIKDISELLSASSLLEKIKNFTPENKPVTLHAPCTLSHGHKLADHLYNELSRLGYQLKTPMNAHLCCGSAGTYSLLQPKLSQQLREQKLSALQATDPEIIITANVGCEHHLNSASNTPVIHWVELVAANL